MAGIPPAGQKTLIFVSSKGVSILYRVNACDNDALVLLHYCALASVKCFIGKLLLHFVSFSRIFLHIIIEQRM